MLWVAVVVVLLLGAGYLVKRDRGALAGRVESLTSEIQDYQLDSVEHLVRIDSLASERKRADSLGAVLRVRAGVARLAAAQRSEVAASEVALVGTSLTAKDSAEHWRAAFMAIAEAHDSLKSALVRMDEAHLQDSTSKANALEAFHVERGRRIEADSLLARARIQLEELRPSWQDDVTLSVGLSPLTGRPQVNVGYTVGSLSDVVKILPGWLR